MHEHVFAVLARDKAEALRVIEPLHSTLFHFDRISWIELRWMNRSDNWQNLAWLGELLLTPGSTLTLPKVYHPVGKMVRKFSPFVSFCDSHVQNVLTVI